MKITKIGHCCLVLEEESIKILTDPGSFTIEGQEQITDLDVVLITHEHQDHLQGFLRERCHRLQRDGQRDNFGSCRGRDWLLYVQPGYG